MNYKFTIKNTATGEEKVYKDACDWKEEKDMLFMWFQHNYACDCNRELFFEDEEPEDWDAWDAVACGDERYTIERIEREDGTTVDFSEYV